MSNRSVSYPNNVVTLTGGHIDELARVSRKLRMLSDFFEADDLIEFTVEGQEGFSDLLAELAYSLEQVCEASIKGGANDLGNHDDENGDTAGSTGDNVDAKLDAFGLRIAALEGTCLTLKELLLSRQGGRG